jgi:hypothetical protein
MDNKGLLEWSEYEVEKSREVLERAEAHAGELREIVRLENAELVEMAKYITYIEKLGVPRKVWMAASIMDALAVLVKAEKELQRRRCVGEEERTEEEQKALVVAHLKKLGVPMIVYNMATSLEELLVMVTDKKAFLRKCGVREEDLKP